MVASDFSSRVHAETLNIFPSRPMHVVAEPSPKAATSASNIIAAGSNLKPQRPPSKQSAMTAPGGKATVKVSCLASYILHMHPSCDISVL